MKSILVAVIMALVAGGCSLGSGSTGAASATKNLVKVQIAADPQLNLFEKNSHALVLCLYHLNDPESFTRLARGSGGMPKLLECGRFDGTVVSVRQVVVQPGQELVESRERVVGARYLGVATGYYSTSRKNVTALEAIPETGESVLRIELGPQEIRQVRVE